MKDQAIARLRAEIEQKKQNSYVQLIGDFLIRHVFANPSDAGRLMAEEKTIEGSLGDMRKAAEKKKVGNMGILSDAEGYAVVLNYFGIRPDAAMPPEQAPPPEMRGKTEALIPEFSVSLEDFL